MDQSQDKFAPHEARLRALWDNLMRTVGIHTLSVLMERAIFEAAQKYPELDLIKRTDEGLEFEALEKAYADRPQREVDDAFNELTSQLLLILARLLGKEMARQLAEELEVKMAEQARERKGGKAK
ncbi:MAG: hypothetical protein ACUVX1_15855 [Chloroflexota bacterium]